MEKRKLQIKKITYFLVGISLAVGLIFLGTKVINMNPELLEVSCVTLSTNDGMYESAVYGGKVTVNGVSMGDKTTFKLQTGQNMTLSAVANDGYHFIGYYDGSELLSSCATFSNVVSGENSTEIYAKFAKIVEIEINIVNPFDASDVQNVNQTCYVGQAIIISNFVETNCDATWGAYYQSSIKSTNNETTLSLCENNIIIVEADMESVTIAPFSES